MLRERELVEEGVLKGCVVHRLRDYSSLAVCVVAPDVEA